MGWRRTFGENWMILRDRRAIFAAIVLAAAYISIILTGVMAAADLLELHAWKSLPRLTTTLLAVNALFLIWRLIVRAFFVGRLYGPLEAVHSVPRIFIANIISLMAARRAIGNYALYCIKNRPLQWDKTTHNHFPKASSNG